MKRALFMVFLTFCIAGGIMRSDAPQKIFPYEYKVTTLENGLKIITIPMTGAKGLVSYYSIVRTGSRDEYEPGHSGFAHFFEHMMFRGTKTYPANMYDKLVTEMGSSANAYTTDDYTAYHLSFTTEDLERVITLESDRFQNLAYEEQEFQTESGAVYGEYRKGKTNPFQVLSEKMQETAFTAHTYKHTTIGFEADIKAMPTMYEYSKNFFLRYYRPENIVVVIAGDFETDETLNLMKKYYGKWQRGYVEPKIPVEPPQTKERTAKVTYPGKTLPILAIAYKGEKFDPSDKSFVAATLLGDLIFGENSEIYQKLVIRQQKVQMLGADFGFNRDPNLWMIYSLVKDPKDVTLVRDEVYKAIDTYQTTLVNAKRLSDLKSRMKYGFLMGLDTPEKVAGGVARYIALTGGIEAIDALYKMYDRITPQDVQDAAKKFLMPQTRTVVTLTGGK
jgi:zinc protease